MYSALALYSIGQAVVIPNWVAGPSNLIAFAILCAFRIRTEERMMVEEFGDEYAAYSAPHEASHSWRLVDSTYRLPGAMRHLASLPAIAVMNSHWDAARCWNVERGC